MQIVKRHESFHKISCRPLHCCVLVMLIVELSISKIYNRRFLSENARFLECNMCRSLLETEEQSRKKLSSKIVKVKIAFFLQNMLQIWLKPLARVLKRYPNVNRSI